MFSTKLNYRIINITSLLVLIYIAVNNIDIWWGIISKITVILSPFIISFIFAYSLNPIVDYLCKRKIPKTLAIIILISGLFLIIISLFAIALPLIYEQSLLFVKAISKVVNNIGLNQDINFINFNIKLTNYLTTILTELSKIFSATVIDIITNSVAVIGNIIVGVVSFVYFLTDMERIKINFKNTLNFFGEKSYKYFKTLDQEIGNYLKGLGIFMFIQLIEYSFLFFLINHPNWLLLGILASITTVIPYFGGLFTNIIAMITASVISKPLFITTTVICLVFPLLDGYLISPKVYGKTNDINPLITIIVISIGGTIAKTWGIIISLPVYIIIRASYNFFKKDLKKGLNLVKDVL